MQGYGGAVRVGRNLGLVIFLLLLCSVQNGCIFPSKIMRLYHSTDSFETTMHQIKGKGITNNLLINKTV